MSDIAIAIVFATAVAMFAVDHWVTSQHEHELRILECKKADKGRENGEG